MTPKSTDTLDAELIPEGATDRVVKQLRLLEKAKREALRPSDYTVIQGKKHVKKSGWSLLATAANVSTQKLDEKVEDLPSGERIYHFTYRALAPNGRFADAVGSASTTEKQYTHPHHDARTLAQTRAYNRLISNLIAGGEVSAEEMVSDAPTETTREQGTSDQPESPIPGADSPGKHPWKVPVTKDQATQEIRKGLRQFVLGKDLQSVGMLNVLDDEVSIVPERPIPTDTALIDTFLLRKVVEPLVAKHHLSYTIQRTSDGLLEAILVRGKMADEQVRKLVSCARWAFENALQEEK
jgi:hypothetical protein